MIITRTLLLLQPGELVSLRFPACHHGLLRRSSLTQRHSRHLLLVRSGRGQVHRQRLGQVACSHLAGFQSTGDNIGHITWASLIDAIMGHLNLFFIFYFYCTFILPMHTHCSIYHRISHAHDVYRIFLVVIFATINIGFIVGYSDAHSSSSGQPTWFYHYFFSFLEAGVFAGKKNQDRRMKIGMDTIFICMITYPTLPTFIDTP